MGETFRWNLNTESSQDFRERLISMDVELLDLNYLNKSNEQ